MRLLAFKLVALVVGVQLFIVLFSVAVCLFTRDDRCTGDKAGEVLAALSTQAFALYAAEK